MRNKRSVKDILDSKTTKDALKIIDSLSKEQVLATYDSGHNILHALVANYGIEGAPTDNLYLKAVVDALVEKNRAILDLRMEVTFTNPITNKLESKEGDTPLEAAIRQDNLALVKIFAPHYEKDIKIFDHRPGEQRDMTPEEITKSESLTKELGITYAKIKTVDNIRENVSPLAFAMRYGQFEMFEYLYKNGFGSLKGIDNLSKYKLENPSKENLEELYRDLFITGESEVLKGLHIYLEYYEGHEDKNSKELIAAVRAGNEEKASKLISQGHYIYDFSGFRIYNESDKKILDFLFLNNLHHPNYNVVTKDINGNTPLHLAAWIGHTEEAKAILEIVKDKPELLKSLLLTKNKDGNEPFQLAVSNGHTEEAKAILEVIKDNPELLQLLLGPDEYGETQLHLAALYGPTKRVKAILEIVKDNPELLQSLLLTRNKDGNNPLHLAAFYGPTERVKAIIEVIKDNPELLQLLLGPDEYGETQLHLAALYGPTKRVKAILEIVKDNPELLQSLLLTRNKDGNNPLHLAAFYGPTERVKAIIEVIKDNPELLQLLLGLDKYGETQLHLAAINGRPDVVKVLLSHGDIPSLSMLLNSAFSAEMNTMLRSGFVRNHTYNAFSAGWNFLTGASKALSGDITDFYDNQAKEDVSKKINRDEAPESNKRGRE
jgi:ankyrin repeat protein